MLNSFNGELYLRQIFIVCAFVPREVFNPDIVSNPIYLRTYPPTYLRILTI
jgi:hypothetical protein